MNKVNQDITRKVMLRLVVSGVIFVGVLVLLAIAFYYYHARAPFVPLLLGLTGSLPAAIMLMSLHDLRLLKVKKPQQPHQPPQRS